MDLQTLSDREEIVDLISRYNKASFYCDVKGYADTFSHDGRYINANHGWVGFGGAEASDAIAAEYMNGTGLQHLCLDFLIDFVNRDMALVRHHMLMFQREGPTIRTRSGTPAFTTARSYGLATAGGFQKSFRLLTAR